MDMEIDTFAQQPYRRAALKKLGAVSQDFRLYSAKWLGGSNERDVMEVTGADFRLAKTGLSKGMRSVLVRGTKRTAFVYAAEFQ